MSEFSATPREMIPFGLSSRYESDIISPSLWEERYQTGFSQHSSESVPLSRPSSGSALDCKSNVPVPYRLSIRLAADPGALSGLLQVSHSFTRCGLHKRRTVPLLPPDTAYAPQSTLEKNLAAQ